MNRPQRILTKARALIERGWVQGYEATSASGWRVDAWSPSACAWCITGALDRATTDLGFRDVEFVVAQNLLKTMALGTADHYKYVSLEAFNDDPKRTKASVLAVLTLAIDAAKSAAFAATRRQA